MNIKTHFRVFIQRFLANLVSPRIEGDWFKKQGYVGNNIQEVFADYIAKQKLDTVNWKPGEWDNIEAIRKFIYSIDQQGKQVKLDSIHYRSTTLIGRPGEGLHILYFLGKGEYFEYTLFDMVREVNATGATLHAFNYCGLYNSEGKILELNDMVNNGISAVNDLLDQGIDPNKIVLQGNSLGGAIQNEVAMHFLALKEVKFRQINGNSFKSMKAAIVKSYHLGFCEDLVSSTLKWVNWDLKPGKNFYQTSPYQCYMHRVGDKTIHNHAKLHNKIIKKRHVATTYDGFEDAANWLSEHAEFHVLPNCITKNPHSVDLCVLETSDNLSAFDVINYYLAASNKYLENHPPAKGNDLRVDYLAPSLIPRRRRAHVRMYNQFEAYDDPLTNGRLANPTATQATEATRLLT
jgi:hypothetical protein